MSNGFEKRRIKLNAGKTAGIGPCIVDGKFHYYISLCTEKKPFSDVEEKIKLEYPEKNNYGIKFFRPDLTGLINAIRFMLKDSYFRGDTSNTIFVPHGQKGKEYEIKSGGGVCEYACSHKPLSGENLELFNRIVGRYKKDSPIEGIRKYLEEILK